MFHLIKSKEIKGNGPWTASIIHLKRDGYALAINKPVDGALRAYTRTPTDVTDIPEVKKFLPAFEEMPPGSLIFGELFVPGKTSHAVRSALATVPGESASLEIFCVYQWGGQFIEDFGEAMDLVHKLGLKYVNIWDRTTLTDRDLKNPPYGYEGYVLKNSQINKSNWWKAKPVHTVDLRIVGYVPGAFGSKYQGLVGSLILTSEDGSVTCSCSGMTDSWRREFTSNFDQYLGKIVEIKYTEKSDKSYRHPRFVRLRDDKLKGD